MTLGRFMTPDWAAKPTTVPYASFGDPQTLNLYSYVENAPVNRADADGHTGLGAADAGWVSAPEVLHGSAYGSPADETSVTDFDSSLNSQSDVSQQQAQQQEASNSDASANIARVEGISPEGLGPLDLALAPEIKAPAWVGDILGKIGETLLGRAAEKSAQEAGEGVATVLKNKATGDAFRDEVAGSLKSAGRDVQTEVSKKTPFGRRVIDIEVSHNGKVLGGVETKTGGSAYKASQRAKDMYLKQTGYPVNVVRKPSEE